MEGSSGESTGREINKDKKMILPYLNESSFPKVSHATIRSPGQSLPLAYEPAQDTAGAPYPGARMVYLCCRIHPLIRDSASVRRVPFHVEWWRDMTLNASKKRRAATAMSISIIVVAIILVLDIVLPETKGMDSNLQIQIPYSPGPGSCAHEGSSPEDRSVTTPLLPVFLMGVVLLRMIFDPFRALVDSARARNLVHDFKGSWSWSYLRKTGRSKIATTMLAVTEARQRSHKVANMASAMDSPIGTPVAQQNDSQQPTFDATCPLNYLKMEEKPPFRAIDSQPNRETRDGHWKKFPVSVTEPMYSSLPESFEWTEQMSLDRVVKKSTDGSQEVYKEYMRSGDLRLAIERVRANDKPLDDWLLTWQNCWTGQDLSPGPSMRKEEIQQMARQKTASEDMLEMLRAWSKEPCTWGPSVHHLESEISVLNKDGEGVLMFPEHLLSTILPRYGHLTTVEEVAYLSAKGARGDKRYYRSKVFFFWFLTGVVMRGIIALTSTTDDVRLVAVVSLGVAGLWLNLAQSAFGLDTVAIVTGRVKEGCILESANSTEPIPVPDSAEEIAEPGSANLIQARASKVTATLLAKWNANVAKESHDWLNSVHTQRAQTAGIRAIKFDTFQRAGGLMIGNLAIMPGVKDLRVRRMKLQNNFYRLGGSTMEELVMPAKKIVSHSSCLVGMRMEQDIGNYKELATQVAAHIVAIAQEKSQGSTAAEVAQPRD